MRLLNVKTYHLEQFDELDIPPYAVLSHRWGEEEVLFTDLDRRDFKDKKAFPKVRFTCEQAMRDGLDYVWIDTLSINKESSAELSEAINSMFRWYKNAAVCYAFLRDIQIQRNTSERNLPFVSSRWFKRGWTLQELIAPTKVVFFDSRWEIIGTRHSMSKEISELTKIDIELLQDDRRPLEEILPTLTVARRMSWAAHRETSRLEDRAYSLMGLFDINMPLLYGEGRKAFVRLQEEIIKNSMDLSILAWDTPGADWDTRSQIFATDPNDFENCTTICPAPTVSFPYFEHEHTTLSILSSGLRIEKPYIVSLHEDGDEDGLALSLECRHEGDVLTVLALRLWYIEPSTQKEHGEKQHGDLCYVYRSALSSRMVSVGFLEPNRSPEWPTLLVGRGFNMSVTDRKGFVQEHTHIWVQLPPPTSSDSSWVVLQCWPTELWDRKNLIFDLRRHSFLDTPYQMPQKFKRRHLYGALALQSYLGRVALLFSHRFDARKDFPTIGSYIKATLVPFDPESFPRGSQTRFPELDGELERSLKLKEFYSLRVERMDHHRYGLQIGHLKLCLDHQDEEGSHHATPPV